MFGLICGAVHWNGLRHKVHWGFWCTLRFKYNFQADWLLIISFFTSERCCVKLFCDSLAFPLVAHLDTLWSSRSSSPWFWRSPRRSSTSRTRDPSSSLWRSSSNLCPGSTSLSNQQPPGESVRERTAAANTQPRRGASSRGGQTRRPSVKLNQLFFRDV